MKLSQVIKGMFLECVLLVSAGSLRSLSFGDFSKSENFQFFRFSPAAPPIVDRSGSPLPCHKLDLWGYYVLKFQRNPPSLASVANHGNFFTKEFFEFRNFRIQIVSGPKNEIASRLLLIETLRLKQIWSQSRRRGPSYDRSQLAPIKQHHISTPPFPKEECQKRSKVGTCNQCRNYQGNMLYNISKNWQH